MYLIIYTILVCIYTFFVLLHLKYIVLCTCMNRMTKIFLAWLFMSPVFNTSELRKVEIASSLSVGSNLVNNWKRNFGDQWVSYYYYHRAEKLEKIFAKASYFCITGVFCGINICHSSKGRSHIPYYVIINEGVWVKFLTMRSYRISKNFWLYIQYYLAINNHHAPNSSNYMDWLFYVTI